MYTLTTLFVVLLALVIYYMDMKLTRGPGTRYARRVGSLLASSFQIVLLPRHRQCTLQITIYFKDNLE